MPNDVLSALLRLLDVEQLEMDLFRGQSQDLGWGTVFGGQVLGQALAAAAKTVPIDRPPHSLHGYFLRPGDVNRPIIYDVDRIRDGGSFTTRRVVAIQNGKAILNLSASFQRDEDGFDHQAEMPDIKGPEGLRSEQELADLFAHILPARFQAAARAKRPLDICPVDPINPLNPVKAPPHRAVWYRAPDTLLDDPTLHRALLAYASDFHFLTTALQPHALSWMSPGMQMASLDHAMYFHRPFRMDEWLLHVVESPSASGGRGLVRGQFFKQDGTLVASTVQEGLIRGRAKGT